MCKEASELIRKQQRPAQSQYEMLEAVMINFILMILCYLKQCLPTDFAENLITKKKNQTKAWYRILGTKILRYQDFHWKTSQISKENELLPAK